MSCKPRKTAKKSIGKYAISDEFDTAADSNIVIELLYDLGHPRNSMFEFEAAGHFTIFVRTDKHSWSKREQIKAVRDAYGPDLGLTDDEILKFIR